MAEPVFRYGVASGDPLADRVVLWTHVTSDCSRCRSSGRSHATSSSTTSSPRELRGDTGRRRHRARRRRPASSPGTTYYYGFRALGESSPIGRTRTLPDPTEHLRFAMVSCAKFNAGFFNAYARIAERTDLDFLLHLGDYIYEASNTPPKSQTPGADIGRPFDPLHECVTLDDYRTRYRQYRRDPDVQLLHAAHPVIATLDDHEFADGAWRDGAAEHKPGVRAVGASGGRTRSAAREEWLPVRRVDPADPERVWRRVPIGGLADLFLIDTRTRRDEPVSGARDERPDAHRARPRAAGVAARGARRVTRATWRLLANPSVMGQTWNPVLPDDVRNGLRKVKLHRRRHAGPRLRPVGRLPRRARRVLRPRDRPRDRQPRRAERRRARVARARAAPAPVRPHRSPARRRVRDAEPDVAEPRRQDGLGRATPRIRGRSRRAPSSSFPTGSGSISTATATSSSTSRPSA